MNTQGMTEITLTNVETSEQATYTVADIQAAKMLAAEDHGGEADDWWTSEDFAAEHIRYSEDATVSMVWAGNEPVRCPTQEDTDELPVGMDMTTEEVDSLES